MRNKHLIAPTRAAEDMGSFQDIDLDLSPKKGKAKIEEDDGLGNRALLDKIDKLRELNIGANIGLPQLVVVGDQSTGKSSVLESLTGFAFPRDPGLCTRYATQITCRREPEEYTIISIIPPSSAGESEYKRLRNFRRRVGPGEALELEQVFRDANREMGIRGAVTSGGEEDLPTFSECILKIEICGPKEDHLTVIDVPGIFRTTTPGVTTDDDIELVDEMVKKYMRDSRTIILAVIPCNADIATQEILKLANKADPAGVRTMGVLTKPDLAIEHAIQQQVMNLVLDNKRQSLKLGYCVVKNRSADDHQSTLNQRHEAEKAFFQTSPWSALKGQDRTGIGSLKRRLRDLLTLISKKEFPHLKTDIRGLLNDRRRQLDGLGEPRGDSHSQRAYLGRLANSFQRIASCALDAHYVREPIFTQQPSLRLITRILELNDAFAHTFWEKGHKRKFETTSGRDDEEAPGAGRGWVNFIIPFEDYPELADYGDFEYESGFPLESSIMDHIQEVYDSNRGPELGTFGGSILETTFKEQSEHWEDLVISHVGTAIVIVHDFIYSVLQTVISDDTVFEALWDNVLCEKMSQGYQRAMKHARFLLDIELRGKPYTYDAYFAANQNKRRLERFEADFKAHGKKFEDFDKHGDPHYVQGITFADFCKFTVHKSNAEQAKDEIHDILLSFYKVSRKRFVDAICLQVIDHFLLNGGRDDDLDNKSPLKVFDSDLVMHLNESTLASVAGEDAATKRTRESLALDIKKLEEAIKVLRV
ncbi:interferon-induced GTP-binding protein Mx2 [Coniochaeta sp. 2T2.1]|nr:interferon-induced GTP-binding protein Mx2 [Coniochaeta sp. 2T2.1]